MVSTLSVLPEDELEEVGLELFSGQLGLVMESWGSLGHGLLSADAGRGANHILKSSGVARNRSVSVNDLFFFIISIFYNYILIYLYVQAEIVRKSIAQMYT